MPETPTAVIERLSTSIDKSLAASDGLQQSLRVDFQSVTLKQLEQTIDSGDLEGIVQSVVQTYYIPLHAPTDDATISMNARDSTAWADSWTDEVRRQLLLMLQGHSLPFDKKATARMMGRYLAQTIRHLDLIEQADSHTGLASAKGWFERWLHSRRDNAGNVAG